LIDKSKFHIYGYISSLFALILFIFPILEIINRCPFGFENVVRISFIQFILAFFAIYFGCCSETIKGKISKYLGIVAIIILILYYFFIVFPCVRDI